MTTRHQPLSPLTADQSQAVRATLRECNAVLRSYYERANPEAHADGAAWLGVKAKFDQSPVTAADTAAHRLIAGALSQISPDIPVISEEGLPATREPLPPRFWLLDPLDGTREFIDRTGEFTVNLALVEGGRPTLAALTVPLDDQVYWAEQGCVRRFEGDRASVRLPRLGPRPTGEWRTALSRRRGDDDPYEQFCTALMAQDGSRIEPVMSGSALKFVQMADGQVDLYPRLHPTSEWDTAAGQLLVECMGGVVVDRQGRPFRYGQRHTWANGPFCAVARAADVPAVMAAWSNVS